MQVTFFDQVLPFFIGSLCCLMIGGRFWKSQWLNFWDWLNEAWNDNCRHVTNNLIEVLLFLTLDSHGAL
jgi:hypothetical protein